MGTRVDGSLDPYFPAAGASAGTKMPTTKPGLPAYRAIMNLTAVFKELPGANTQGATLDEARANLREAMELVLEANRVLAGEEIAGQTVRREPFPLVAA